MLTLRLTLDGFATLETRINPYAFPPETRTLVKVKNFNGHIDKRCAELVQPLRMGSAYHDNWSFDLYLQR